MTNPYDFELIEPAVKLPPGMTAEQFQAEMQAELDALGQRLRARSGTCKACGCTDDRACTRRGCFWFDDEICSSCAECPSCGYPAASWQEVEPGIEFYHEIEHRTHCEVSSWVVRRRG